MARVLFVVHGMGEHPAGWQSEVVDTLNEACADDRAEIEAATGAPLAFAEDDDAGVRVVPVAYDDLFESYWDRHAATADDLEALADEQPSELPGARPWGELWDWLAAANDGDDEFLRTHVADVLLFRFFPTIRQHVVDLFAERIATTVAELPGGLSGNTIGFLAHSLGTAVTQATLERLAEQPVKVDGHDSEVFVLKGAPLFDAFFALANVSRVLEIDDVYTGPVAPPGRAGGQPGYVGQYHTFRHELDPVPMVRRFAPVGWPTKRYFEPPPLAHVLHPNVHGYGHYLHHPAVHLHIVNGMYGGRPASATYVATCTAEYEEANGRDDYALRLAAEQIPTPCRVAMLGAPQRLRAVVQQLQQQGTIEDWLRGLVALEATLRAVREACGGDP